jgi:phenylacetate-CoA ligase
MLQNLRKSVFWATDIIKGSSVSNHLHEIQTSFEDFSTRNHPYNKKKLHELLEHASQTTDYYAPYKNLHSLPEFPVINKDIIRNHFDAFKSETFDKNDLLPAVTSGSTGTPFKIYHNRDKKLRNNADTIFFAQNAGYQIGQRLYYLKIWVKDKMSSFMHYRMQNMVPVDVISLNEDQIRSLISDMEGYNRTISVLGYVSALEQICKYLDRSEKEKVHADVASVITMSESLTPYVKERMEKYFGASVYSRYSNLENGILAQQVPGSNGKFLLNSASYLIEVLKMSDDEPAEKGELGRIVVTDLYNKAMPMIRYDTGDAGILSEDTDEYGNVYFEKIEGRKLDMLFDTSGNVVSSYIMYKNMWQYTEIKQYQLIQEEEKRYRFKINIDGNFERENQLVTEFISYLGKDAEFEVEYVDEIPLLDSGKRQKIVNRWKNQVQYSGS